MDTKFYAGDIVLYTPTGNKDSIGQLIGFFTGGHVTDVSHAAMILSDSTVEIYNNEHVQRCDTVEMSTNILRSKVTIKNWNKNKWDKAYIMRFKSKKKFESKKLVEAANIYMVAHTKYDLSSLIFLAGLIIFKWRANENLWKYCNNLLRYVCRILSDLIKEKIYGAEVIAMMCSQLVYQIYADCGSDYQIKIMTGVLQEDNSDNKDRIIEHISDDELMLANAFSGESIDYDEGEELGSVDNIINELYQNLVEKEDFISNNGDESTALGTKGFDKSLAVDFLKQLKLSLNLENTAELESLFVTPYDIHKNAINLQQIGEANIDINGNY